MVRLNSMREGELVSMVAVARMRLGQIENYQDDIAVLNVFAGRARREYLVSLIRRLGIDLSRQKQSLSGRLKDLSLT